VEANLRRGVYEIECYASGREADALRASLTVRANAPLVAPGAGTAVPGTVRIVQFAFVPASVDVPAGTRVTWTNGDPEPHTITADDGAFDSRQLDPGAVFSVLLDTPGTFTYHCDIHQTMVGTVIVH
jgi:plastocyanin